MSVPVWVLNLAVAALAALNAIMWGYTTMEVGDPQPTLSFLLKFGIQQVVHTSGDHSITAKLCYAKGNGSTSRKILFDVAIDSSDISEHIRSRRDLMQNMDRSCAGDGWGVDYWM